MKPLLFFMGLTIGALSIEVINQREKSALALQNERAYHEGNDEGYDTGWNAAVGQRKFLLEDEPGWNCKTMGNKICGKAK